jgi:hypothetical protein
MSLPLEKSFAPPRYSLETKNALLRFYRSSAQEGTCYIAHYRKNPRPWRKKGRES